MARKYKHNLSHHRLLTSNLGQLVPCGLMEVLPGDEVRHNASAVVRLSPMAAPVMHQMSVRVHHFMVPHRLSWPADADSSFEEFITGGADGTDASTVPTLATTGTSGDLFDYLGLPDKAGINVSALPVAGVNLVFNEWFRDQDLVPLRDLDDVTIPNIGYEKDYFTTARPWPQKGEEVTLPLGTRAEIKADYPSNTNNTGVSSGDAAGGEANVNFGSDYADGYSMFADLSAATAATINSLRRASALQRFAEARARWGSRYAEYVRPFGARPLDARLQRPELLGSGAARVSISEVLQTAESATPRYGVGDMYGHGIGMARSNQYRVRIQEHGYVISFLSIRPRAMYSNGVERTWLRKTREDFFQHELAHIGQQQVLEQEVFADNTNEDAVFGWSDRYAEYRGLRSHACGEFRTVLDYWHLARDFATAPALNQTFVEVDPADTKRIFNEQDNDSLWCSVNHSIQARRVVPKNATARLL